MELNHSKDLLRLGRKGCSPDSFSSVSGDTGLLNFAGKAVRLGGFWESQSAGRKRQGHWQEDQQRRNPASCFFTSILSATQVYDIPLVTRNKLLGAKDTESLSL